VLLSLRTETDAAMEAIRQRCKQQNEVDDFWKLWEEDDSSLDDEALAGLEYAKRAANQACATAPILDIVQGLHDRLYSRLFNS
jgi:hypothetical protein